MKLRPELSDDDASSLIEEGDVATWNRFRDDFPRWKPRVSAEFWHRDLTGIKLHGLDLRNTSGRGVVLAHADLRGTDLRHSYLQAGSLASALLQGANLSFSNLHGVDLSSADLSGTRLENAELQNANLTNARLRCAMLRNTVFTRAVAVDTDFRDAKCLTRNQLASLADATGALVDSDLIELRLPTAVPRVFLSYAWADKFAVIAVDQWLRDHGARVIVDERNFLPGESIRKEIVHWIQQAGVVVCFVSENSRDRPYPELEREIAHGLQNTGAVRVIYFVLDSTELPIDQHTRIFIPASRLPFDTACAELWRGITRVVKPPEDVDLRPYREARENWVQATRIIE